MKYNPEENETPYKKKKSQKSKASKKSDHKHINENVIVETMLGWKWAQRCRLCGKMDKWALDGLFVNCEFRKPEYKYVSGWKKEQSYSFDELRRKYPHTKIFCFIQKDKKEPKPSYEYKLYDPDAAAHAEPKKK